MLDWKTSGTDGAPVLNDSVPVWPSRSGRLPKVIEMTGLALGGHAASTLRANGVGVGNVVVVPGRGRGRTGRGRVR